MEFQFTHTIHGVMAKCSMDHEAFGRWLNTEIAHRPQDLVNIFDEIEKCRLANSPYYEAIFEGREYSLYLNADEVMAKANNIDIAFDDLQEMEEGFHFYNEESIAFCGLDDFEAFLQAYQRFLATYH